MKVLVLILAACGLVACDDKPKEKTPLTAEQRAENPLLKLQDDTTNRAQKAVDEVLNKQQTALEGVDK